MGYLIGIDEAGVGPVLGPLVIGGVRVEERKVRTLNRIGVKDSKLFGSGERAIIKRATLWQQISRTADVWVERIPATELDNQNWILLEIEKIAEIMNQLSWGETEKVFVGWVGKLGERRFLSLLYESLKRKAATSLWELQEKLVYLKNAEQQPAVAAASVLAKTERDQEVKRLCEEIGFDFVSGYCNTQTAEFLKKCKQKHGRLPSFVRKSRNWPPLKELL